MNSSYRSGDILEVDVEKIVPRGYGLGFAEGLTVFVALAAAGDRLRVRLREVKGKTAFAEIEEIIEASPDRVGPPCPYFGECGGCDFQQLSYAAQLDGKVAIIRDCLERIGKIDPALEIEIIPSPEPFGYRLRAQWHAEPGTGKIGYFRRNSRELVDIEHCAVVAPKLGELLENLRSGRERFAAESTIQIDAACGDNGETSIFSTDLLEPTTELGFSVASERYIFSARTFFQGNRFLIDRLIETAIGDAVGETAVDLYCGVGLFTLPLARRFGRVIGVEENETALEFADRNAAAAGLGNIELYAASVRNYLASEEAAKADFVLLDPPRFGTEKDTMMNLIGLRPKRVSYVACEPSILARDLKRFVANEYQIDSITAIDLFPQTHHVETVAHLSLA